MNQEFISQKNKAKHISYIEQISGLKVKRHSGSAMSVQGSGYHTYMFVWTLKL